MYSIASSENSSRAFRASSVIFSWTLSESGE